MRSDYINLHSRSFKAVLIRYDAMEFSLNFVTKAHDLEFREKRGLTRCV
jgi:hypothetical protein